MRETGCGRDARGTTELRTGASWTSVACELRCFVEVAAAGPLALERRRHGTAALAAALLGFDEGGEIPITALAAAGGLSEVIHHEIVAGRGDRLVAIAPDLVETVMSPIWSEAGWQ